MSYIGAGVTVHRLVLADCRYYLFCDNETCVARPSGRLHHPWNGTGIGMRDQTFSEAYLRPRLAVAERGSYEFRNQYRGPEIDAGTPAWLQSRGIMR